MLDVILNKTTNTIKSFKTVCNMIDWYEPLNDNRDIW